MYKIIINNRAHFTDWELQPGTFVVGRKEENDYCIPNSTISRRHFQLDITDNNDIYITDLGSQNGTYVNSEKISEKTRLHLKDSVKVGEVELRLVASESSGQPSTVGFKDKFKNLPDDRSIFIAVDDIIKPSKSKIFDQPNVLETFFKMAKMLVHSEPKEAMLQKSLELIFSMIPAERMVILTDAGDGNMHIVATKTKNNDSVDELNISRTIINRIVEEKTAVCISDMLGNSGSLNNQQSVVLSSLNSVMAVPMFDEQKVLGVLYVDTKNPLHQYNTEYLNLLASVGNILGNRLVNYELIDFRAEQKIIDAEIKRASTIQEKLLSINPPHIEGYSVKSYQEQCRAVGGDLYDIATLADGTTLLLVADVSGKGMGAALLMSNILASFRILYHSPEFNLLDTVKRVSEKLFEYSSLDDFATMFIAKLDAENNKLHYINCGHNPPLLTHADGSQEYLKHSGIMIGAIPGMDWEEHTLEIKNNDSIVIYTDGVTEAEGPGSMYGEKRLEQIAAECYDKKCEEIVTCVVKDIDRFTGDTPQSDDVTLMVLKRN